MIISDTALERRELNNTPIRVAIIGTGVMGMAMINQINRYTPGMKVVAAFNRTIEKTQQGLEAMGISDYVMPGNNVKFAKDAIYIGKLVITDDIDVIMELQCIDVIVEATGSLEFGVRAIFKAFEKGIHVLSFNAELDSTLGPLIKLRAEESGVKYSLGDGDQPGVTMNLYRYVKGLGLDPLLCGNVKGLQDNYRNPETQKGFAAKWGMKPEMVTSFADGTKISFEQSCVANATGMKVAKRGMLGFNTNEHIDDIKHLYDIDQMKELGGIVDFVVGAKPAPGVFVYGTTEDPVSMKYLNYCKMGEGPLYSFYVPYHLVFFEIPSSICRLIDYNDPVIVSKEGPCVDVVAAAKVDLNKGDLIDGIGGFKTYGLCENHDIVNSEGLLLMGLARGCRLKRKVLRDEVLTFDDVEIDENNLLSKLRDEQRAFFP